MNIDFRWFKQENGETILQWRYLMRHSKGTDFWSEWQTVRTELEEEKKNDNIT